MIRSGQGPLLDLHILVRNNRSLPGHYREVSKNVRKPISDQNAHALF